MDLLGHRNLSESVVDVNSLLFNYLEGIVYLGFPWCLFSQRGLWIVSTRTMIKPLLRRHSISTAAQFFEPAPSPTRAVLHQVFISVNINLISNECTFHTSSEIVLFGFETKLLSDKICCLMSTGTFYKEDLRCVEHGNIS